MIIVGPVRNVECEAEPEFIPYQCPSWPWVGSSRLSGTVISARCWWKAVCLGYHKLLVIWVSVTSFHTYFLTSDLSFCLSYSLVVSPWFWTIAPWLCPFLPFVPTSMKSRNTDSMPGAMLQLTSDGLKGSTESLALENGSLFCDLSQLKKKSKYVVFL